MIQIFSNSLGEEELAAIKRVIDSKWLGMGPECSALEKELGQHFGAQQVLLFNCCTSAIKVALRAAGIGPGDEVIIPTANFIAIPSAVRELGGIPVFADVHPETFALMPEEIIRLKSSRTKAVFLLHYGGHPVPFDEIQTACGDSIQILEDSANSVASSYKGKHCGTLGDFGVFSFDAMKTLVMGDGGAMIVRDPEKFRRAKSMRYLGFAQTTTSGFDALKQGRQRWWEFDLEFDTGRFISNDIMASIGRVQLQKLPRFIEQRKQIWQRFQEGLKGIDGLILPPEPLPDTTSSYYLYWVRVPGKRDDLARALQEKQIYTTFRYFPLHLVKHFESTAHLPNAESMNEEALNLPLHQNLTEDNISHIIESVRSYFGA